MSTHLRSTVFTVTAMNILFAVLSRGAVPSADPEIPASIPYSLTAVNKANLKLNGTLTVNDVVKPEFDAPYLKLWGIHASEFGGKLLVEPSFEFVGPLDPERMICTDLRALDRDGKLLYHTWELSGDGRIGPAKVGMGAYKGLRSRLNAPSLMIPRKLMSELAQLDIRFRELSAQEQRHFPTRPHKCDPRITEPGADGEFEISFINPVGAGPIESDCLVAFECVVYDSNRMLVRTDFRVVKPLPDSERYRFKVNVEPECYAYSDSRLGFFRREQGQSEEWLLKHLSAEWGVTYSGCSDGGKLIELPLVGAVAFDDLPAPAKTQSARTLNGSP